MTTARDIVTRAMRLAGILVKMETPSADELNDGLVDMNAMLSSWSNDSMMITARTIEPFTLVAGTNEYTIGTGQSFNTTRPVHIVDAYVRITNIDYNMEIITDENYANIDFKSARARPYYLNYDNAYPYGKIKLYPTPDTAYTLYILSEKPMTSFTLDDDVDLPAGWEDALCYNLSVRLSPQYGQPLDEATVRLASSSKNSIQRAILKARSMDAQPSTGRKGNVFNGWSR